MELNLFKNNVVFDLPNTRPNIIKVIGVGGAGGNAVNHMYELGIKDVDFLVTNTDYQALEKSRIPLRLQLGPSLTEGRGAGNQPEIGRNAAIETIEEVKHLIGSHTKMVFVTAGMGGGTGTGAAPIIAQACREMGILTVGIVTLPFGFEGKKRLEQANRGLEEMRQHCDTTLVISNDKVRQIYGNLAFDKAFARADDVLATAAKGIAEIITVEGYVNVDYADVKTVLEASGKAVMGSATAEGEGRAMKAVELALSSPLLSDNDITGARSILLNISSGSDQITLDEIGEINDFVQEMAGSDTDIIWGNCNDDTLGASIRVTVIATGFEGGEQRGKITHPLGNTQAMSQAKTQPVAATRVAPVVEDRAGKTVLVHAFDTELGAAPAPQQPAAAQPPVHAPQPASQPAWMQPSVQMAPAQPANSTPATDPSNQPKMVRSLYEANEDPSQVNAREVAENQGFHQPPMDDMLAKSMQRIQALKGLNSLKRVDADSLESLEREPAYMRRNVDLDQVQHSSDPVASRYTLSSNEGQARPEIRPNNSFLHDNVD